MGLFGPNIGRLSKNREFDELVALLGDERPQIRSAAQQALKDWSGDRSACAVMVPLVLPLLDDPVAGPPALDVLGTCIFWVWRDGPRPEVGTHEMIAYLDHGGGTNSIFAAVLLLESGEPSGATRALGPLVRWVLAGMEGDLWERTQGALQDLRPDAIEPAAKAEAVTTLVGALKSAGVGSPDVARIAQTAVLLDARAAREQVLATFVPRLRDAQRPVREEAATVLGKVGGIEAAGALVGALDDESPFVREAAEEALKQADADTLRAALQGRDPAASPRAFRLLAELGDSGVLEDLITVLGTQGDPETVTAVARQLSIMADRDGSGRGRARAQEALAAFRRTDAAIPFVVYQFMHGPPSMVVTAGQDLAEFGDRSLEPLLEAMGDPEMLERYRAVAPMAEDEAKRLMLELTGRRVQQLEQLAR